MFSETRAAGAAQMLATYAAAGYCHTLMHTGSADACNATQAVLSASGARAPPASCVQYRPVGLDGAPLKEHQPLRYFKHYIGFQGLWWKWVTAGKYSSDLEC